MSFPSLPVELVDNILQSLASTDLLALSRTCSSLTPVALRLLYRNITVSHNLTVVTVLAKRSDLANFVRSFSLNTTASSPLFPHFYHFLAQALSRMTELTSLHLLVDSSNSWILEEASQKAQFERLQQFTCSFPLDSHVAKFLDRTPALLRLEVDSMPYDPSASASALTSSAMPHLVQFIGSVRAAKVIVPGRPVEGIHLNEGDLAEEDVARLAESTANVSVLDATASEPPVPLLESIAHHLPHLAYLRIMTTYHFTHAPQVVSFSYSP